MALANADEAHSRTLSLTTPGYARVRRSSSRRLVPAQVPPRRSEARRREELEQLATGYQRAVRRRGAVRRLPLPARAAYREVQANPAVGGGIGGGIGGGGDDASPGGRTGVHRSGACRLS